MCFSFVDGDDLTGVVRWVQEGKNETEVIIELETGSDVLISCLNIKGIRRTTNIVDKEEMGQYFLATFKMKKGLPLQWRMYPYTGEKKTISMPFIGENMNIAYKDIYYLHNLDGDTGKTNHAITLRLPCPF